MRKGLVLMLLLAIVVLAIVGVGAALADPNCDNEHVAAHNKHCDGGGGGDTCSVPTTVPAPVRDVLCLIAGLLGG